VKNPNIILVQESKDYLLIRDIGPWDKYPTITNAAEETVKMLAHILRNRRLFYYDSENHCDELLVKDGKFAGFKAGGPSGKR